MVFTTNRLTMIPNPNEYKSNSTNIAAYISQVRFTLLNSLKQFLDYVSKTLL